MRIFINRSEMTYMAVALAAMMLFLLTAWGRLPSSRHMVTVTDNQVVIAAPLQILMYGGDRFLAADIEAMRVAAIGPSDEVALAIYRVRAHRVISHLNPCHEDNIYLSNAMLTWGGAPDAGIDILERATECRFWDDIPPFFLGFNRYFFHNNLDGAREAIDIAAARSVKNRVSLQQISIVMASKKFNDLKMAAVYLRNQRDSAIDKNLAEMLNRRLGRLEGLITLREAHARYVKEQGNPLSNPGDLITAGILTTFPQDPMHIGYEFADGRFQLRSVTVGGVEIR